MKSGTIVDVVIRGRDYQLRSDEDPQYVRDLAAMVDARMAAAEAGSKTVDSIRIAVLAALNLADEYCRLEKEYTGRLRALEQERERLEALIDATLEHAEHSSLPDA